MSATQDKSQKITFVYSNLYHLYRKGHEAAKKAEVPVPPPAAVSGKVLKTHDLGNPIFAAAARVNSYNPAELIGKRLNRPNVLGPSAPSVAAAQAQTRKIQNSALSSLKDNLKNLNDLHSRLRFMLQELEDLVKE